MSPIILVPALTTKWPVSSVIQMTCSTLKISNQDATGTTEAQRYDICIILCLVCFHCISVYFYVKHEKITLSNLLRWAVHPGVWMSWSCTDLQFRVNLVDDSCLSKSSESPPSTRHHKQQRGETLKLLPCNQPTTCSIQISPPKVNAVDLDPPVGLLCQSWPYPGHWWVA